MMKRTLIVLMAACPALVGCGGEPVTACDKLASRIKVASSLAAPADRQEALQKVADDWTQGRLDLHYCPELLERCIAGIEDPDGRDRLYARVALKLVRGDYYESEADEYTRASRWASRITNTERRQAILKRIAMGDYWKDADSGEY